MKSQLADDQPRVDVLSSANDDQRHNEAAANLHTTFEYTEERFIDEVEKLCTLSEKFAQSPEEVWRLQKGFNGRSIYAMNECFITIDENDDIVRRCCSICYSAVYNVPVLWFNFYATDGRLILLDEFREFAFSMERSSVLGQWSSEANKNPLMEAISQNEHPNLGIAFYNFHPCRTGELLRPLASKNYVISFLSLMGSILGFQWPLELFTAGLSCNAAYTMDSTERNNQEF